MPFFVRAFNQPCPPCLSVNLFSLRRWCSDHDGARDQGEADPVSSFLSLLLPCVATCQLPSPFLSILMDAKPPLPSSASASARGSLPPSKPWEHGSNLSGRTPFKPSAPGKTSDVVEASGTAKPGEVVTSTENSSTVSRDAVGRPLPTRPWQQNYGNSYGGYNSGMNYNSNFGSGMYGSYGGYGGGVGGLYGGGIYGNSIYRGYGSPYGGSGLFGGGMYNSGFGGPMGSYGTGVGDPFGQQDPNDPFGPPLSPPGFWVSFLRVMNGVVTFFGRISILIDQNTQAFHMFMTALLQLFDRGGLLYGELARFVLRLFGIRTKSRIQPPAGSDMLPGLDVQGHGLVQGSKASNPWNNVWEDDQ